MRWWQTHDPERDDPNWGRSCAGCGGAVPAGKHAHDCGRPLTEPGDVDVAPVPDEPGWFYNYAGEPRYVAFRGQAIAAATDWLGDPAEPAKALRVPRPDEIIELRADRERFRGIAVELAHRLRALEAEVADMARGLDPDGSASRT